MQPKAQQPRKRKQEAKNHPRVPPASHGLNINHCKNPVCPNFGVPVPEQAQYGASPYTIVATASNTPAARCNTCGEVFGLKSNGGVFEEAWRILSRTYDVPSCPEERCPNHRVPVDTEGAYHSFGTTKAGSRRYRCKADGCGRTFSVKPKGQNPIRNQRLSDKNKTILSMLVNKMPFKRICEAADVSMKVLLDRIDFFHEQSLAFMAARERGLRDMNIDRLHIGVDRQDHVINWTRREDKRNVTLSSVAAADNKTGYVFGFWPNFDPDADPKAVEAMHIQSGDLLLPACHRRHARLWTAGDYAESVGRSGRVLSRGSLTGDIAAAYATASARQDIEAPEIMTRHDTLPEEKGMLVHAEYTLHGFFVAMRQLLGNVGKVRFYLDQDSGMRSACLSAFHDMIKGGRCDAFYVRIAKDLTVDKKRERLAEAKAAFEEARKTMPTAEEWEVRLALLKANIAAAREFGPWRDRWVMHPMPSLSEPEKALCHLTDLGQYDPDHLAWLYDKASLHAVDSFFNRVRRRCSMLERPISSSSNHGRVWNAYSAYRPERIFQMQSILRACHNYVWTTESRKAEARPTPAVRLGLAKAALDLNDIIYFR